MSKQNFEQNKRFFTSTAGRQNKPFYEQNLSNKNWRRDRVEIGYKLRVKQRTGATRLQNGGRVCIFSDRRKRVLQENILS